MTRQSIVPSNRTRALIGLSWEPGTTDLSITTVPGAFMEGPTWCEPA